MTNLPHIKIYQNELGYGTVTVDGARVNGIREITKKTHYGKATELDINIIGSVTYEGLAKVWVVSGFPYQTTTTYWTK
jgi:hypothetical protein